MSDKKPIEQKQREGTARKDRIKLTLNYDPLIIVPKPAFKLNGDGLDYFNDFCNILISKKILTIADVPIITRAARYYEIYKAADEGVQKEGAVQITATGYTAKNGYFVTFTDCEKRITEIESLYGMNFTARSKINLPKEEKKNPFDDL